jgi:hypothetical protein
MSRLKERLATERDLQKEGIVKKGLLPLNCIMSNHILQQDLRLEGISDFIYELNIDTKNRLMAHTREDEALAVGTSDSTDKTGSKKSKTSVPDHHLSGRYVLEDLVANEDNLI